MKVWFAASWFGALLALSACAPGRVSPPEAPAQPPPRVEEPPPEIRVGLLLPLSGAAASLGQDMLNAAQMALFDVGDNDLVLLPRDTGGSAGGAREAARQVIDEGAEVILGPLFSQAVQSVASVARQADVRVLAFSNVASVAEEGTFLLGFRPEEQVTRVARYALDQGLVEVAGLAPDDAYGRTAIQSLRQAVLEGGGSLGPVLLYPPDQDPSPVVRQATAYEERQAALEEERARLEQEDDPRAEEELRRLETLDTLGPPPFDAILLADGGDRLRSVASLLAFFDVDASTSRFLGTMRWQDDPQVRAEPALRQGWYAAPPPEGIGAFEARFADAFGRPPQALAALAYDATALAVIVARDLGDRSFDPVSLTNAEGFTGASGLFRLRPDGLAQHGLAILEMTGTGPRVIDPAPESFIGGLAAR